jgi:hypothetical protein
MKAVGFGLVAALLTFVLWFGLIVLIGHGSDSSPVGICGPTGPCGMMLFIMGLASPFVCLLTGILTGVLVFIFGVHKGSKPDIEEVGQK